MVDSGAKERVIETKEEAHVEIELDDLRNLIVAPEQNPFSDRPMEYLGQSALERMMHIIKPSSIWQRRKRYHLTLFMPAEKVSAETAHQAHALIEKFGSRILEDNANRIKTINRKGLRMLPYSLAILFICMFLGVIFGLEYFYIINPLVSLAVSEGFYIIGWVALWGPMDTLLFEPMDVRRENKVLRLLMEMRIDVVAR